MTADKIDETLLTHFDLLWKERKTELGADVANTSNETLKFIPMLPTESPVCKKTQEDF